MTKCTQVEARPPNRLSCTLSDGRIVEYTVTDIDEFDTEVTRPLRDPEFFKRVFLEFGTPTWPNGYDICADVIAQDGVEVGRVEVSA